MNRKINVGVVGATGLVGELFLRLLEQRKFPLGQLKLYASAQSKGKTLTCQNQTVMVEVLTAESFRGLDVVFFSSGDDISQQWAPIAEQAGALVIDNSAAFRMDSARLLVVPEVNGHLLPKPGVPAIIANPNCSTIQLVCALKPLLTDFGLESVHVATYQAVSGAGREAQQELAGQMKAWVNGESEPVPQVFPHTLNFNCIPHIGSFSDNGFCSEEIKIMKESKKILGEESFRISAFTVRIPSWNAHSEAVWVRLKQRANRSDVIASLKRQNGLTIEDELHQNIYPTAKQYSGLDLIGVGRIHQDLDDPNTWILWIVADNLRKGAALNGIQIAERIFDISARP